MRGALGHPRVERALDELSGASDAVWLVALATGLGLTLVAAYPFAHTPSGVFWAYAGLLIRGGLYLWAGDALPGRGGDTIETMFRVGLVAGLLEILVDWALIHWVPTGRLVYLTGNDVVMLGSPIWMPLAWACVIVLMFLAVLPIAAHALSQADRRQKAVIESGALFACAIAAGYFVAYVALEAF